MTQPPGKIMLIGSGPGDPELLTLKAARAIQAADVLLVDALVHPAVLDHAKTTATIIDVGKRAGIASPSQDSINELMVAHAKKGLLVARVKGGDPMLFSRAGEELLFAARNRVTIEVINGVTAACAVAASSLIPLTLRGTATSVVFITGTTCSQHDYAKWNALAQSGSTLVFYMALSTAGEIADNLIKNGMNEHTPVAVVQQASLPNEESLFTILSDLGRTIQGNAIQTPATIIIGECVLVGRTLAGADTTNVTPFTQGVLA